MAVRRALVVAAAIALWALALWPVAFGGQLRPMPATEVTYRKQLFADSRVSAYLLEIPPQHATLLHRHERDFLTIFVNGGKIIATVSGGKTVAETIRVGDIRFRGTGFTHATRNTNTTQIRSVILEFAEPQGIVQRGNQPAKHYCADDNAMVCVDEQHVLCTAKFCVEDVRIAPDAVMSNLAVTNDQMLIAISDLHLVSDIGGSKRAAVSRASGEIEYLPAGASARWKNAGSDPAHFVLLVFRD